MTEIQEVESAGTNFARVLDAAARLPGVRINRDTYLRSALKRYCTGEQIERAVAQSPAAAGISLKVIKEAANTSITYETTKVTGLSALAGIPGGLGAVGTVPADLAQNMGHMLRVAQKLAYVYGWPDLFDEDGEDVDEATENMLMLFVGAMFGLEAAQTGVRKVALMVGADVAKRLPRSALTKGVVYPIVRRVSVRLGARMTTQIFANGVAKAIPVLGAALSGGLTLGTFLPMAKRLQKHLASLELTKPGHRPGDLEAIDLEATEDETGRPC